MTRQEVSHSTCLSLELHPACFTQRKPQTAPPSCEMWDLLRMLRLSLSGQNGNREGCHSLFMSAHISVNNMDELYIHGLSCLKNKCFQSKTSAVICVRGRKRFIKCCSTFRKQRKGFQRKDKEEGGNLTFSSFLARFRFNFHWLLCSHQIGQALLGIHFRCRCEWLSSSNSTVSEWLVCCGNMTSGVLLLRLTSQ